ncbi:MAG: glycosyltransferase [Actinomycetota bacterium]|nr:glycosyltransferase [Actinomycetota bacterium]
MKTAVYNRFWESLGGGERYAGMIASTLAADGHEVDLIGPRDVDTDKIARHLSLDLDGVRMRVITDDDESKVAKASADYDLFVTSTYMSRLHPLSARSAYVCFFPTPADHELSDRQRFLARHVGRRIRPPAQIRGFGYGTGWYPPEGGMRHQYGWSNGHGVLELPHGSDETFNLRLGRPGLSDQVLVSIADQDGKTVSKVGVGREFADVMVTVPASMRKRTLHLLSETEQPQNDNRSLGVALSRDSLLSKLTPPRLLARQFPWLTSVHTEDRSYLKDYESIVTISEYTQSWVQRLWQMDSDLLFPPIDVDKMQPATERDNTIITIGRFFDPSRGHSKRQLEMVEIFRRLIEQEALDGWTLHMIGGCEEVNRPYFEKVMAAADGLQIELHPNTPRHILNRLINRASIFWSATGMHEDTERRPWRNEHFGMTTAEAMAAGCVPVVIDRAGQREIVRDGIDGYRWESLEQAVALTAKVARDPVLREKFARSSMTRARDFSDRAFADRWRAICQERGLLAATADSDEPSEPSSGRSESTLD